MDWIKETSKNKTFWHITTYENINSIKEKGLKQSEDGQQGKGLYGIKTDYEVLDSVIELLEQKKNAEVLMAIEFTYSGEYYINPVDMFIESSEGWVLIPSDITPNDILRCIPVSEL